VSGGGALIAVGNLVHAKRTHWRRRHFGFLFISAKNFLGIETAVLKPQPINQPKP
jgi:hypothetical protein